MKLVRYVPRGQERPGIIDADGRIHDVGEQRQVVVTPKAGATQ
jgi:hypothetical protein